MRQLRRRGKRTLIFFKVVILVCLLFSLISFQFYSSLIYMLSCDGSQVPGLCDFLLSVDLSQVPGLCDFLLPVDLSQVPGLCDFIVVS